MLMFFGFLIFFICFCGCGIYNYKKKIWLIKKLFVDDLLKNSLGKVVQVEMLVIFFFVGKYSFGIFLGVGIVW